MNRLAICLDDRALCLARKGAPVSIAPSAIVDSDSDALAGMDAWSRLRLRPTAASTRHLGSLLSQEVPAPRDAALVAVDLRQRLLQYQLLEHERIWFATPARVHPAGLGALLALSQSQGWRVDGFADSATIAVAALDMQNTALVLELGLHHAAVTLVETAAGEARRRRAAASSHAGLLELYQAWLELISRTLVRRTRFDPFYEARTEQQLFDALPHLARQLTVDESATASLDREGERFEVTLSRDQFIESAASVYRRIIGLLHELRPAGIPVTLIVPQSVGLLPGFRNELEYFAGCDLVMMSDGFVATACGSLELLKRHTDQRVRLLRRLPCRDRSQPSPNVLRETLGTARNSAPLPSHIVLEGRPHPLAPESIVIGRSPDEGAPQSSGPRRSIRLAGGSAGVSRRHCTLVHDGGAVTLLDHSAFGTFVNGERVVERAPLFAGDRIRLGTPGVELTLIAIDPGHEP